MAYIGKSPDGTGVRSRFYYTQSSGGGTSVSGTDDNSNTLAFSDGEYVDVFLNGVLLVAGTDYNTNTANTISGLAALADGDVVEVVVYDIFTVADTVSASQGGTFNSAVEFGSGFTASDGCTITTADNDAQLTLTSTDADSTSGPELILKRDSGSPADADAIGRVKFVHENDADEEIVGVQLDTRIVDASDGTEDSRVIIQTMVGGSLRSRLDIKEDSVVVNQEGQDLDFRVESDAKTAAFFVEGGGGTDGFIGLNTSTPQKMLHLVKNDSDGIMIFDADGTTTDHQIVFAKDYGTGGVTGGNYWGIGVDGSENRLVFAFDANSQASLSADAQAYFDGSGHLYLLSMPSGAGNADLRWNTSTGRISYDTSSRLVKENIIDCPYGLAEVVQLQPRKYTRTDDQAQEVGFIADEVSQILPEFVPMMPRSQFTGNEDHTDMVAGGVNYAKLTAVLTKAIQEQQTKITALEARVAALEAAE